MHPKPMPRHCTLAPAIVCSAPLREALANFELAGSGFDRDINTMTFSPAILFPPRLPRPDRAPSRSGHGPDRRGVRARYRLSAADRHRAARKVDSRNVVRAPCPRSRWAVRPGRNRTRGSSALRALSPVRSPPAPRSQPPRRSSARRAGSGRYAASIDRSQDISIAPSSRPPPTSALTATGVVCTDLLPCIGLAFEEVRFGDIRALRSRRHVGDAWPVSGARDSARSAARAAVYGERRRGRARLGAEDSAPCPDARHHPSVLVVEDVAVQHEVAGVVLERHVEVHAARDAVHGRWERHHVLVASYLEGRAVDPEHAKVVLVHVGGACQAG